MTRRSNRQLLNNPVAWAVGALTVSLTVFILVKYLTGTEPAAMNTAAPAAVPEPTGDPVPQENRPSTLGAQWQIVPASQPQPDGTDDIPFHADALYEALQDVRLDANGDVILDDLALEALNESLQFGQLELSQQNLADLRELIQVGLPGEAGEQTAKIVTDYYHYLEAKSDLEAERKLNAAYDSTGQQPLSEQQYRELQQLRERHLGAEVAGELFKAEDARARYMFEAQRIQAAPNLTTEEKLQRVNRLNDEMQASSLDVDNWPDRHQRFQEEKRRILAAGLSDQDKQSQVRALMHRHFEPDELERIDHLQLDNIESGSTGEPW